MSAYMVTYLDAILDQEELDEYARTGPATAEAAGAIFHVKGGDFQVLDGDAPLAVFVLEFPTMEIAQAWFASQAYQEALKHRRKGAKARSVLVAAHT